MESFKDLYIIFVLLTLELQFCDDDLLTSLITLFLAFGTRELNISYGEFTFL